MKVELGFSLLSNTQLILWDTGIILSGGNNRISRLVPRRFYQEGAQLKGLLHMFQMPMRLKDNDNVSHVRGIHRKAGGFFPRGAFIDGPSPSSLNGH